MNGGGKGEKVIKLEMVTEGKMEGAEEQINGVRKGWREGREVNQGGMNRR